MCRWGAYLVSHLGTGVNVEAQVVLGQLGGLFLQLPGEGNLPEAERQVFFKPKKKVHNIYVSFVFIYLLL